MRAKKNHVGESNPMYGKSQGPESRSKIGAPRVGKKWATDGRSDRLVTELPEGHRWGRASRGWVWVRNGRQTKQVHPDDFESWVMAGWRRGRSS